jgi:hypothetical protein
MSTPRSGDVELRSEPKLAKISQMALAAAPMITSIATGIATRRLLFSM